jgi:hypothetical protein
MRFGVVTPQRKAIVDGLANRAQHPSLARGEDHLIFLSSKVMVEARVAPEETALLAVNRSETDAVVPLPAWMGSGSMMAPRSKVSLDFRGPVSPPPRELRAVDWVISSAPAKPGEAVLVAGMGPELGGWDPSRALGPLAFEDGRWEGHVELPSGGAFELKLIVRHADGSVEWEPRPDRYVFVPEGDGPVTVDARWGETD